MRTVLGIGVLTLGAAIAGCATMLASPPSGALDAPPPGRIAFMRWSDQAGGFQVFTIASDGTNETLLLPGVHEIPQWSPDGASIATTTVSSDGRVVPAIVGADGSGLRELSLEAPLNLGCGGWSADGQWLYCEGWVDDDPTMAGARRLQAADGGGLARLTEVQDVPSFDVDDGSRIVFVRPLVDGSGDLGRLWVMDADGSGQRQLSDHAVGLTASLSPDGRTILADTGGSLVTVDLHDGTVTRIPTPGPAYMADWSHDGSWLVFAMHMDGDPQPDLYLMRRDGSGLTQLTDTPGVRDEAARWSPR